MRATTPEEDAAKIKLLMTQHNISRKQLVARIGISEANICRILQRKKELQSEEYDSILLAIGDIRTTQTAKAL